jgi:HSP20 family protein
MLARWNPWQDLFDIEREMSQLMRGFGTSAPSAVRNGNWAPAVDVFSRHGDLVVRAELPGIDPERDIDISVQDNVLSLRGERRHEERSNGDNFYRVETSYGSFQRHIPLPEGVSADDIQASYKDGILEVVVPKAAELSAPKKIPISVGSGRKALTTKGSRKK